MPFIEALLGYAVTKSADSALEKLGGGGLTGKLRATVEAWGDDLPPEARLEEPRALFAGTRLPPSSRRDSGHEEGPALSRLRAALEESVPSREQWQEALVEQWRRVRRHVSVEDAQAFFTLPEADARAYLQDLAGRLAGTCAENEKRFRRTVIVLLRRSEAAGRSGGTARLLTDQTRYYISDSDGNRYISKSPDGVPQDQCAYATLHVTVVLEAFSHWTAHGCKLFLFRDSKDWHESSLFKGGERSWPLTGMDVRRYLTRCAEHAGRQSPPYNTMRHGYRLSQDIALRRTGAGGL